MINAVVMFSHGLQAQEIKIRTEQKIESVQSLELESYDGKTPFFDIQIIRKNPHYYDGCKIVFLPHKEAEYDYTEGFHTLSILTYQDIKDTIWNKRHTAIKKITPLETDVYKPHIVSEGKVRNWYGESLDASGSITTDSGVFTPISAIEGCVFHIDNCKVDIQENWLESRYIYTIKLVDSENVPVIWEFSSKDLLNSRFFIPVLVYDYIEGYNHFIGNTYVLDHRKLYGQEHVNSPVHEEVVTGTEISFISENLAYDFYGRIHFYTPALFFNSAEKEYHYSIIPKKGSGWLEDRQSMRATVLDDFVDADKYFRDKAVALENTRKQAIADSISTAKRIADERAEKARIAAAEKEQRKQAAIRKQKEKEQREAEMQEQRNKWYSDLVLKYGEDDAKLIAAGRVRIGWSAQKCRESWGTPREINRTTNAYGVTEQWVYSKGFLYFKDGILTTIQD